MSQLNDVVSPVPSSSEEDDRRLLLPGTVHNDDDDDGQKQHDDAMKNTIVMSISFFLTFCALNASQNYATTPSGNVGPTAVGILYSVLTVSNIVSSGIVLHTGPKIGLIFGSFTYIGYVFANIIFKPWIMYPTAALLGFGGAILWTAEGVYITRLTANHDVLRGLSPGSSLGYFNGVFFFIFQGAQFAGNLLVAVLFSFHFSTTSIFATGTCVALGGTLLMFFVRNVKPPVDQTPTAHPAIMENLLSMYNLLRYEMSLQLLVPFFMYSGNYQGFIFGTYPSLIKDKAWKFYVMAAFGASDAVSSIVAGKLSDRLGRNPVVAIGVVAHICVYITLLVYDVDKHQNYYVFFPLAVLLGVGDGVFNTQLYAIVSSLFPKRSEAAFANVKFWQALLTSAAFFYSKRLRLHIIIFILCALLGVSQGFFVLLNMKQRKKLNRVDIVYTGD